MDKLKFIFAIFILLTAGLFFYVLPSSKNNKEKTEQNYVPINEINATDIYFPIQKYNERITYRTFGTIITTEDNAPVCGRPFSGYHNANDLEIFSNETEAEVAIFAMSEGEIVENANVDGYGGLIVEKTIIDNKEYTINYGHIKLNGVSLNVGEKVLAGQKIAILGKGCSEETSGERKHLHFAIRKGSEVDVKGYLATKEELQLWENPRDFLTLHGATEPK